ncbi:hypothetical protein FBU59_004907, partial [Linderina macrospora]
MLSPAQELPTLILERIIKHAMLVSKGVLSSYMAKSLVTVCRWWRAIALTVLHGEVIWCNIKPNPPKRCHVCFNAKPSLLHLALSNGNGSIVKKVTMHWEGEKLLGGDALKYLQTERYSNLVIPSVTEIEFCISFSRTLPSSLRKQLNTSAVEFSNEVRRIFPNATGFTLGKIDSMRKHGTSTFMKTLFTSLSADMVDVTNSSEYNGVGFSLSFDHCPLRKLVLGNITTKSSTTQVVRRSAETLEELVTTSSHPDACMMLILDDSGQLIIYSRLTYLKIACEFGVRIQLDDTRGEPAGAPFPVLKTLVCSKAYPFRNDVMFRGNESTLEVLKIALDVTSLGVLDRCGILDGRGRLSLKHVWIYRCLYLTYPDDEDVENAKTRLSRFAT